MLPIQELQLQNHSYHHPLLPLSRPKTPMTNNLVTYEDRGYGITILHPSNWDVEQGNDFLRPNATVIVTFIPPGGISNIGQEDEKYHTYVGISLESGLDINLNEDLSQEIAVQASLKGFKVIESNTIASLANRPAYVLVYEDKEGGFASKTMSVGTMIGDKAYDITYQADPQKYNLYLPTVKKMIGSFKLINGVAAQKSTQPDTTSSDFTQKSPQQPIINNNPPTKKQIDRYYQGLNWWGICNNPLLHSYISQPCNVLVTPDKNALTAKGKHILEGVLCPRGPAIVSTLQLFYGKIPDKLKNDLSSACGWH
jgi:photosystem II reaction center protein PsbP